MSRLNLSHDPSEIILRNYFLLLFMLKIVVLLNIFMETVIKKMFFFDPLVNRKFKRTAFIL